MNKKRILEEQLTGLKELSIEKLRSYKGLEKLLEKDSEDIVNSLKLYSLLTYKLFENINLIHYG